MEVAAALLRQSVSDDGATPILADRAMRMLEAMPREERDRMAGDLGANSALEFASCRAAFIHRGWGRCRKRIAAALGREVSVDFIQDPELIAGVELRLPHCVVNCSWQAEPGAGPEGAFG